LDAICNGSLPVARSASEKCGAIRGGFEGPQLYAHEIPRRSGKNRLSRLPTFELVDFDSFALGVHPTMNRTSLKVVSARAINTLIKNDLPQIGFSWQWKRSAGFSVSLDSDCLGK
jgi:hypothetical protein